MKKCVALFSAQVEKHTAAGKNTISILLLEQSQNVHLKIIQNFINLQIAVQSFHNMSGALLQPNMTCAQNRQTTNQAWRYKITSLNNPFHLFLLLKQRILAQTPICHAKFVLFHCTVEFNAQIHR